MTLINTFMVNALYWCIKEDSFQGYVRLTVNNCSPIVASRTRKIPHSLYPISFVPFVLEGKHCELYGDKAVLLREISMDRHFKKQWEKVPLVIPRYEQSRFGAIVALAQYHLPDLISRYGGLLELKKPVQSRRFLGGFPELLRPETGIPLYGTLSPEKPTYGFSLHDSDLRENLEQKVR
ncbi:MAG: hypothetical protein Q7K45_06345 [Nanoarchaeota archaeon]|nr:hypothetical protein [Nanoarchaeota archaeon]